MASKKLEKKEPGWKSSSPGLLSGSCLARFFSSDVHSISLLCGVTSSTHSPSSLPSGAASALTVNFLTSVFDLRYSLSPNSNVTVALRGSCSSCSTLIETSFCSRSWSLSST
jgi:hypothetical protein